jgi:hypothetical protein
VKKYLAALVISLVLLSNAGYSVFAQSGSSGSSVGVATESMMVPPTYPTTSTSQTFLGQDQYYTVTFRGNGEAVVTLKVIFSNLTPDPISTITLRMPKAEIQDVLGFQVMREPQCMRYEQYPTPTVQPMILPDNNGAEYMKPYPVSKCAEYQAPDYYQYWYGVTKYQKAAVEVKGDTIVVGLPAEVQPDSSASFMLYYRAMGFTKKNIFGAYSYNFETLKAEDKVRTLQVGISTDSDLVLKDAQGAVDYVKPSTSAMDLGMAAGKSAMANSQLDSAYQQIGSGSIVKTASNLQPLESYKVKGAYAPSTYALYGTQLFFVTLGVLLVLGVLVFFVRKMVLHFRTQALNKPKSTADKQSDMVDHGRAFLEGSIASFIASIMVAGYTVIVMIGVTQFNSYYYSEFNFVIMIFVTIISFAVYSLFMFGPAIYLGVKRGYLWGLATFVMTTLFLVVYLVVIAGFIFLIRSNRGYYPGPIYNKAAPSKT